MKTTKILTPIGDKLLVKPLKEQAEESSLIHIPDSVKGEPQIFEVLRVGTYREDNRPFDVAVGDHIMLNAFVGTNIKVDGVLCKIILSSDVLGVYKET